MKPAIIVLNNSALALARSVAGVTGGEVHGAKSRVEEAPVQFEDLAGHLAQLFASQRPIIGLMASGALIRLLAPHLNDKHSEPPVLAVSDDGASVVPLLGGHRGANDLANKIAGDLRAHAAITTAGDLRFGVALDAPPKGYSLVNPEAAKAVMAELAAGGKAKLSGSADWITSSGLPIDETGSVSLTVTDQTMEPEALELVYAPRTLCLGIGCERGAEAQEIIGLAEETLTGAGFSAHALAGIFSIDLKADEAAIHATAEHFDVPARFFDAETLEAQADRLANPSDVVFAEVGCHGVCEGAALAAAGKDGVLTVAKQKSRRATCAIAFGQRSS